MQITRMKNIKITIILLFCIYLGQTYDKIDDHQQIMAYYEQNSVVPIMHVYYNRHFSTSKQYKSFLQVIQQTEYEVGSYAKILLTDCEYEKSHQNMACKEIKRLNENRMIVGYQPNSKFTSFGDKVMQAPPSNRVFDHYSDTYTVQEFVRFINQQVPNFFKQISNTHEFEQFKQPKYVPKLIFIAEEGQVAQVIKQLGVQFFLKFDMAYVEDLTQSVINQLEIKASPALIVLKHNFETGKLEIHPYNSHDFSEDQYEKIKRFLSRHALKQRRNDYVFHLIKPPRSLQIQTVDTKADLDQTLDRIKSWVLVEQGPSYNRLVLLKNKYGLFYDYVHYLKPQTNQSRVTLINPRAKFEIDFDQQKIQYRMMNAEDLHSNMTVWLRKDYVVMGVRQQYGYLCTLVDKPLFAGLAQCYIIQESQYEKVSQNIKMKFKYGFIVSASNNQDGASKVRGNEIKTLDFYEIYRTLEYTTKIKIKEIIDDFIENPVKNLIATTQLKQLCAEPFKKCIFYFYEPSSDKTKLEYLQLQAVDFVNEYKIYSIDLSCNQHLYEQIPQLKEHRGGLIAYHPRQNKYVYLKAKMTRHVIRKFLQINNQDKKTLPFKTFSTEATILNRCNSQIDSTQQQVHTQQNKQQEQFAQQL